MIDFRPAARLLGRHIFGRAHDESAFGQSRAVVFFLRARDAEIDDLDETRAFIGAQQNVGRLDIAMNHAVSVRVIQRGRDLTQNRNRFVQWQLFFALEKRGQIATFEQLHREIRLRGFRHADRENRRDMRMMQVGRGARFAQKTLHKRLIVHSVRQQHFDRFQTMKINVMRFVNFGHAAAPQNRANLISADATTDVGADKFRAVVLRAVSLRAVSLNAVSLNAVRIFGERRRVFGRVSFWCFHERVLPSSSCVVLRRSFLSVFHDKRENRN